MDIVKSIAWVSSAILTLSACSPEIVSKGRVIEPSNESITIWPQIESEIPVNPDIEKRVAHLLSQMTLPQKVAQMIQPEIRDITVEDMRRYGFGSYLNGGGAFPNNNKHSEPSDWIALAEAMYQASMDDSLDGIQIPTMWGTDAVHGHNNVIGATLFPHNIGLGAANNPELIEHIAKATATEVMVTGIDWVFAPTVATVRDDRWGRTYESYSEDPSIVKRYAASIVRGLQGTAGNDFLGDDRVISTVKHFIGDGGTVGGDDQGNNVSSEQELFDIHGQGYVGGLSAGAQSVMASFNSWHGEKAHGSKYLLTDVLKDKMGFDGFVVGDWNGHGQIPGCTNESCPQAVNAGLDIFMVPTNAWKPLLENTIKQVEQGEVALSRIDDAVTRILRVKFRAGLFDKPSPAKRQFSGKTELIGHKNHRKIAKQAVRESLVLLKNKQQLLPLNPKQHLLIAGDAANNIGKQSGGWTITWQGTNNVNEDFPGGSSIFSGFKAQVESAGGVVTFDEQGEYEQKPDVAIVVFGEEPYAEGHGDRDNLAYQRGNKSDLALLAKLKSEGIPVVSVFITGRPLWVNAELNASDAFVVAWLPGSEGSAIADVLLRDVNQSIQYDFSGKLSFSWPRHPEQIVNHGDHSYQALLPYGFGMKYGEEGVLSDDLDEVFTSKQAQQRERKLHNGQVLKPWHMTLYDEQHSKIIQSSSLAMNHVSYRTIDRYVQEDAFQLAFDGEYLTSFALSSSNGFSEDLSGLHESKLSLLFSVKVSDSIENTIEVGMSCERMGDKPGSCSGAHSVRPILNQLPKNQWHDLAIPLSCFANKGVQFDKIVSPFVVTSDSRLTLSISQIQIASAGENSHIVECGSL